MIMLVHLFNFALKARNGSAVVALRWTPVFSLPVGDRILTYSIVGAWCIERPTGGLVGEYPHSLSAFAAAWRTTP
jgi:hypothetical protein